MPQPKTPSVESIKRVFDNAYSAPQANCLEASKTLNAIQELDNYFIALMAPADAAPAETKPPRAKTG